MGSFRDALIAGGFMGGGGRSIQGSVSRPTNISRPRDPGFGGGSLSNFIRPKPVSTPIPRPQPTTRPRDSGTGIVSTNAPIHTLPFTPRPRDPGTGVVSTNTTQHTLPFNLPTQRPQAPRSSSGFKSTPRGKEILTRIDSLFDQLRSSLQDRPDIFGNFTRIRNRFMDRFGGIG